MKKIFYIATTIILLLVSCQSEDKFEWNAGISAPKNYIAGEPFVEFFYKGKSSGGTSSNVGINPGWGITSGGYVGAEKYKDVPDSIVVSWRCGIDMIKYRGGFKLPRNKMIEEFRKKSIDSSIPKESSYIIVIAGMAPGGNVAVWMQKSGKNVEIARYKAKKIGKDDRYNNTVSLWNSKGREAKSILDYVAIHGIPYSVWEKDEKKYSYDIGFESSKSLNSFSIAITGISKDGSYIYGDSKDLKNYNINHLISFKKAPVHFTVRLVSADEKDWYEGEIVLHQNLEKALMDFGKNTNIVISIPDLNKKEEFVIGDIFIQNQIRKEVLIKFRLSKFNFNNKKFDVTKYTIPKDFDFPNWKLEEIVKFPKIDYWQSKD